ncbi:hypothetical protein [Polaromonas jejuensis]|uniref:Uncharacterized protein n=1 Tax=Polaromonas jejuensis TaxID=457502 RepID=A0ABW0Q4H6_9BURK|nr:hypothetical protein [Polaromonas jejuensis]
MKKKTNAFAPETAPARSPASGARHATAEQAAEKSPLRQKRLWVLALGTAAVWHLNPAFGDMAQMIGMIACATSKGLSKDAIAQLRLTADSLRPQIAPLPAHALSLVVRRAEAACGAVLDKGARVKEVETSWDNFLACVQAWQDRPTLEVPARAKKPRA